MACRNQTALKPPWALKTVVAVRAMTDTSSANHAAVLDLLAELSSRYKAVTRSEFMRTGDRWAGAEMLSVRGVKTATDVVAVSGRDRRRVATSAA